MSDTTKKRWLIKDRDGRVRGPFYTDDILTRISRGEFSGEEYISLYPSTNWISISNDPQFYDQLLASLDEEQAGVTENVAAKIDIDEELTEDFIESRPKKTTINRAERISKTSFGDEPQ